jgi:phosphatidylglycerol:prolipoprotein diacylglycerol transferase
VFPQFGKILGEPVPAYFTLLLLGFGIAIYNVVRWAKRVGVDHQSIIDCGLASIIGGIVGGRLLHVVADGYFWDYVHLCTDPSQVAWNITKSQCSVADGAWDAVARVCRPTERDCFAWAKFYNGGLAYYGGLLVGSWAVVRVASRDKLPILKVADVTAVGVAFGLFCGRIGCFLGGCCYGVVTDHAFGMSFPPWSAASEGQFREGLIANPGSPSLPVHPTQLYEALGCLVISVVLNAWGSKYKRFDGQVGLLFLILYALLRFGLEIVRADDRGIYFALSTSQWLSIAILVAVALLWKPLQALAARVPFTGVPDESAI